MTTTTAPAFTPATDADVEDRDTTIRAIRTALRARTGVAWSVTGGTGSSWGWITITAPPKRRNQFGSITVDDQALLSGALGQDVHHQGVLVPASQAFRREYVNRARGLDYVAAEAYWD